MKNPFAWIRGAILVVAGCSGVVFDSGTTVRSVRILTTHASQSSPAPGDTIQLDVLAVDGRADQTRPMKVYWFPDPCINPEGDAYYECYPAFQTRYPIGTDITSQLSTAPAYTLAIPADIIAGHRGSRGTAPYGEAVVFSMACTGHIEAVAATAQPEAVPFGCFDEQHNRLGADDWVFAYTTIFAYDNQKNENPTIDGLTFGGGAVDLDAGITVDHCTAAKLADCPTTDVDAVVPASAQEMNPRNVSLDGNVLREQIYVEYFVSAGKLDEQAEVLYDPHNGRLAKTEDKLFPPQAAGEYRLWAVVHDDRGGSSSLTIPLHAR